jgi:hypothetical protein
MAAPKKGGRKATVSNSNRNNGKAAKQNPGQNPSAITGKTKGGYSPAKVAQRAALRG